MRDLSIGACRERICRLACHSKRMSSPRKSDSGEMPFCARGVVTLRLFTQIGITETVCDDEENDSASQPLVERGRKELKSHSKARTPVAKIAKVMKRTEGALRRKAGIIGIGSAPIGSFRRRSRPGPCSDRFRSRFSERRARLKSVPSLRRQTSLCHLAVADF
jgi:hypothetical protein